MFILQLHMEYINTGNQIMSTAVEQAVACAPVTQRAPVRFLIGTSFLGEVFSGFSLTCKTNVRNLQAHKVPDYHLAVIIIISYSPCSNEWVYKWCVSSLMFVLSRRCPRHSAKSSSRDAGRPSMSLLVKKVVCDPQLVLSPDRYRLCKAPEA